ncbi:MAG: SAM-dependent methyltransferase [Bacteroidetes bacterium]|nr:SAM-dependent methyltransferase [Bacteroidota bacterium]
MSLSSIVIDRIQKEGALSFHDFMEMALYYPGEGYYTSAREKLGAPGDFYTSPYLTSLFGEMLAGQLEEMWIALGRVPFTIVEYGAGTGLLCRDILRRLSTNRALYDHLHYYIIEKSDTMRERERALLSDKVRWVGSIGEIGPVTGCVLSNELVDNLAVHQVIMAEELMEVFVGYDEGGGFREVLRPAGEELRDYLGQLGVKMQPGYRGEINLEATKWIQEVAAGMGKAFVMTIDYGCSSSVLYGKKEGTLVCYHEHRLNHSPFSFIGEQDITSHVNFSALDYWGRKGGLECCGYTTQAHFLQGLGLAHHLRQMETAGLKDLDPATRQRRLWQLRTLLLDMGQKFKVLIQRKGTGWAPLSGMQFAQGLG